MINGRLRPKSLNETYDIIVTHKSCRVCAYLQAFLFKIKCYKNEFVPGAYVRVRSIVLALELSQCFGWARGRQQQQHYRSGYRRAGRYYGGGRHRGRRAHLADCRSRAEGPSGDPLSCRVQHCGRGRDASTAVVAGHDDHWPRANGARRQTRIIAYRDRRFHTVSAAFPVLSLTLLPEQPSPHFYNSVLHLTRVRARVRILFALQFTLLSSCHRCYLSYGYYIMDAWDLSSSCSLYLYSCILLCCLTNLNDVVKEFTTENKRKILNTFPAC